VYLEHLNTVLADNDDISKLLDSSKDQTDSFAASERRVDLQYEEEEDGEGSSAANEKSSKIDATTSFFLKDLFKVLEYMYGNDQENSKCYKIVIDKSNSDQSGGRRGRGGGAEQLSLNFWCLDASVVFKVSQLMYEQIVLR
jgi:hypothetical protein